MKSHDQSTKIPGKLWTSPQPFTLASGEILPLMEIAYQTWGTMNAKKDNAVLVCPALNASHMVLSEGNPPCGYSGWWSSMVGPGKPIDTERFYVLSVSNLGTCFGSTGPRSIDPLSNKRYGSRFPSVTVTDWVRSQALLADHLHIEKFAAVTGGSLGGMQALEWSLAYPERVRHTVAIAATPSLNAQNIAFNEIARQAISQDPDFARDHYDPCIQSGCKGLQLARMIAHMTYTSAASLGRRFGRERCEDLHEPSAAGHYKVGAYLSRQGKQFSQYFDVHSYLRIMHALDTFDIARDYGEGCLAQAMGKSSSDFLLISFSDDWRFDSLCSREIEQALRKNGKTVAFHEVPGNHGHDGFLLSDPTYHQVMRSYFSFIQTDHQSCFESSQNLHCYALTTDSLSPQTATAQR